MPTPKRFYPTLATVVSTDDLPEVLGFIKDGLSTMLGKIHFKDLGIIGCTVPQDYKLEVFETDVFENVNKRELELGCASIASFLYLLDQYF